MWLRHQSHHTLCCYRPTVYVTMYMYAMYGLVDLSFLGNRHVYGSC